MSARARKGARRTHLVKDLVSDIRVLFGPKDDLVGDEGEDDDVEAFFARGEDLGDGAHADDVCAGGTEEAALGGGLVGGARDVGVNAFVEGKGG